MTQWVKYLNYKLEKMRSDPPEHMERPDSVVHGSVNPVPPYPETRGRDRRVAVGLGYQLAWYMQL